MEAAAARTDDVMDYTQMKIKAQQMFTDVSSTVCVLLYQTHVTRAAAVKEASALWTFRGRRNTNRFNPLLRGAFRAFPEPGQVVYLTLPLSFLYLKRLKWVCVCEIRARYMRLMGRTPCLTSVLRLLVFWIRQTWYLLSDWWDQANGINMRAAAGTQTDRWRWTDAAGDRNQTNRYDMHML